MIVCSLYVVYGNDDFVLGGKFLFFKSVILQLIFVGCDVVNVMLVGIVVGMCVGQI